MIFNGQDHHSDCTGDHCNCPKVTAPQARPVIVIIFAALALALAGCGDHPVPEHGTIIDADHHAAWVQILPGNTFCSGSPPICNTTPMQIINHPEDWSLTVRDLKNHDWEGTMTFSEPSVYNRCNLGELWPE